MDKRVSRRSFLRTVVVSAGAASLGPSVLSGCADDAVARPVEGVFPQSVASGDPRPDSIVLWTRAVPDVDVGDGLVGLELSTDPDFTSALDLGAIASLTASVDHDHCVRVKVTGLEAATTYYYRFAMEGTTSRTGRFRTAPAAGDDAPVRFALLSCQDRVGRYYNSLLPLLDDAQDDLAFILHVGDYVYETTGDPGFMSASDARNVPLRSPEEAIELGSGDDTFFAARSLGNYRDLYRIYRSDPVLQQVHERFAFICTWDDHEFSDDSWGDHGTYTDGVRVEQDTERRRNADQAWFEYMPVALDDAAEGALDVPARYPDTRVYRDFRFGQHCTLAVTDYRTYRPDHPTPEDAYPGAVLLDEDQTRAALAAQEAAGELPDGTTADDAFAGGGFRTYVDLDDAAFADHARALELLLAAGYEAEGVDASRAAELAGEYAQGLTDAALASDLIEAGRASLPADLSGVTAIDPADASLPRGLPVAMLGKTALVGQLGARYLTVQRTYDLVQVWRTRVDGDTTHDDAFGDAQETWLRDVIGSSDATWKVVASSVQNGTQVLDLRPFATSLPEGLPPERFYLNVDQFEGFPERRRILMEELYRPNDCVLLAGDIHGAYGTDWGPDAEGHRAVELVTPAVSSETFRGLLFRTGSGNAAIRDSGLLEPVTDAIDAFMMMAFEPLKHARSDMHGALLVTLEAGAMTAAWHMLPAATVEESFYDDPSGLADRWEISTWTVAKTGGANGELTGESS